ncbi:MAG TPA: methyl-accepting chemotaxis protein [Spirochaetota bacterium]|nr:methyl-accepting chemotaxis protein [Spirochaetota bacterium]
MNTLVTEKIINRIIFILATFFLLSGISSVKSGSHGIIYFSILAGSGIYYLIYAINYFYIKKETIPVSLIYISLTIEVLTLFFVKFSFHFDEFNGYGLSIKEPATFIIYFVLAVVHGLRYNKGLNIYYGLLATGTYVILILLGIFDGNVEFIKDSRLIFTPQSLRFPTEFAKILFLGGNTYFLYLMADFTSKNIRKINEAKAESDKNLSVSGSLLVTVKKAAGDLTSSSGELRESTNNIAGILDDTSKMIQEITEVSQSFTKSIGEMRKKISTQNETVESNFKIIEEISELMEEVHGDSEKQSTYAREALVQAEMNEKYIQISSDYIFEMRENSIRIEEISKTINEIADQTNLLSLNAAIESARAGEFGRGFAVVSDEISKLAGISSDSSKDISNIIKKTVQNIADVSATVESMSEGMKTIIDFVKGDSAFIEKLNQKTGKEYTDSRLLYSTIEDISRTTKEVVEHFNRQTELNLVILEWMEKITSMSERISSNINTLMIVSQKLENRSNDMNGILADVNAVSSITNQEESITPL